MNVLMKAMAAGPNGILAADKEYQVADGLGEALCRGGYAVEVARKSARAVREEVVEPVDEVADAAPEIERATTRGRRGK